MRLDRPIGTWLLLLPGWWSLTLAQQSTGQGISGYHLYLFGLFAIGALLMRGAGCIINDIWDRNLDKKVARTASRPLASGAISLVEALSLLAMLLFLSLLILIQMNITTIALGVFSLLFVAVYPSMKRFTWWPQAFLGLTFNFGALMGWTAIAGELSYPALLLYTGGIFWTLGYDTIYALQDKHDDALIGIKSTALLFKTRVKAWVGLFYALAIIFFIAAALFITPSLYTAIIVFVAGLHFAYQLCALQLDNADRALMLFKSNRDFGLLLLVSFFLI